MEASNIALAEGELRIVNPINTRQISHVMNVQSTGGFPPVSRSPRGVQDRGITSRSTREAGAVDTFFGLPAHPLLVHLTVVAIPVAALLVVVVAVFPRVPRLVKITAVALAVLSMVLMPLMESSGEALEQRVVESAAVERHTEMGETLIPWVIGMVVVIVAVLLVDRRLRRETPRSEGDQETGRRAVGSTAVTIGLATLAIVVAVGAIVQTVRIGHSGAQATWSTSAVSPPGDSEEDGD